MKYLFAILGFGLIVIVHELGHFTLAKINKVKVKEFSIGFGPRILSFKGKETRYSLKLFPIGGAVEMLGEDEEVNEEGSFSSKSPLRRISIIVAGAFMNFVLAIVIYTAVCMNFGFYETTINEVVENGPIAQAGLQAGDKITNVDGTKIFANQDISFKMNFVKGEDVKIKYKRDGKTNEVVVTPQLLEDENRYIIGASFKANENPTFVESFKESFNKCASVVSSTFQSIKLLIQGQANFKTDVGGPVTIIKMSAGAAEQGLWQLFNLVAFLSVSIGIMNLLPFPALDGGWTILLLIELITGKQVPEKVVIVLNNIGFALLMGLMLLVTIKDIIFPVSV